MHRFAIPLLFLLGAALALLALPSSAGTCRLQVIPDYTLAVTYRAVLRLAPECPDGTVLRVRKSSTVNTRQGGAPFQPIKPTAGAWEFGAPSVRSPVPSRELWTLYTWRWEYWDASARIPLTGQKGRWLAAEVLHAAP